LPHPLCGANRVAKKRKKRKKKKEKEKEEENIQKV